MVLMLFVKYKMIINATEEEINAITHDHDDDVETSRLSNRIANSPTHRITIGCKDVIVSHLQNDVHVPVMRSKHLQWKQRNWLKW